MDDLYLCYILFVDSARTVAERQDRRADPSAVASSGLAQYVMQLTLQA